MKLGIYFSSDLNLELSTSKASKVDDDSRERLFVIVFPEQLKAFTLDAGMESTPTAMQLNLGNCFFIEALLQNFNKSSSHVSLKNLFVSLLQTLCFYVCPLHVHHILYQKCPATQRTHRQC